MAWWGRLAKCGGDEESTTGCDGILNGGQRCKVNRNFWCEGVRTESTGVINVDGFKWIMGCFGINYSLLFIQFELILSFINHVFDSYWKEFFFFYLTTGE